MNVDDVMSHVPTLFLGIVLGMFFALVIVDQPDYYTPKSCTVLSRSDTYVLVCSKVKQ